MKYRVCLTLSVLGLLSGLVTAKPPDESNEHHRQRCEAVFKKLLEKMDPVPGMEWPPELEIETTAGGDDFNAFAHRKSRGNKIYPVVTITWRFLRVACADDNALAYVLSHELGHIYHRHILRDLVLRPMTAEKGYGRTREYEADLFGARLATEAGYSLRKGIHATWKAMKHERGLYSSLRAFQLDHPGWDDRFARMAALLDNEQLGLWRSMSSYNNGVVFLQAEQYEAAEVCFARVVREFPKCHEAWVNLGVARLMQYCELLSADDLRTLGVGQILGANFYRGTLAPEALRGDNKAELWQNAVNALRMALELRRDQPLALANLGLAFLVHPGGKEVEVGAAERYLQEAVDALTRADGLDRQTQVILLVNLGVARLAGGSRTEGLAMLEKAAALEPALRSGAVGYNRAMALATGTNRTEQVEAADLFEGYLRGNDPSLGWWTLAFERYEALGRDLGRKTRSRDELRPAHATPSRVNRSVTLADGTVIALADPIEEIIRRLGEPAGKTKEAGSSFSRLAFPKHGIELLVDEQEVVAIMLTGLAAPTVTVRGTGPGAGPQAVLRIGMSRKEVEAMPGGTSYVHRPLTQYGRSYHYYRHLGLAVHYDRPGPEGVVQELVLVLIPD